MKIQTKEKKLPIPNNNNNNNKASDRKLFEQEHVWEKNLKYT
jgi:hypothetical protein